MNLKKQKIGYWVGAALLDVGIILLAQSGWESRGYWLHPLLELGVLFLLPGIVIGIFTQRCPFCGKFLGIFFFAGKKEFCPYCGAGFDDSKGKKSDDEITERSEKNTSKDTNMATDTSLGLAVGLSLGVLFGILTDNIGLGMMIGVAVGLCGGSTASALKGKKKETSDEEKKDSDK